MAKGVYLWRIQEGERMGWKVKTADGMMREPMTLLPLAPKSSYQTLRVWSCGLLHYPHWEIAILIR
jgi:hypothetical protein